MWYAEMEMPKYQCHKKVWALKIKDVRVHDTVEDGVLLEFEDERYGPKKMPIEYLRKHDPQPGGYLVVYEDGYESFSPAKAFEEGYTLIE